MTEQHDEPVALKPCPFCGGEATGVHEAGSAWFVDCDHADGCLLADFQRSEGEIITAWNTRPAPSSDMVEALARAIRDFDDLGAELAHAYAQAAATVTTEVMAAKDAELAKAKARVRALEEAFRKFTRHSQRRTHVKSRYQGPCSCGLDNARAALGSAEG